MIRRSFLKLIAASPLLGLVKKKTRSGIRKCTPEETEDFYSYMEEIHSTTGTSGGGPVHVWEPTWGDGKNYLVVCDCDKCKKNPEPVFYIKGKGN